MVLHRPVELAASIRTWGSQAGTQLCSMVRGQQMAKKPKKTEPFGVQQYLSNAGVSRRIAKFKKGQVIFSQDDPCDDVLYIQSGNAKLTIVNPQGKEAILAIVGPGESTVTFRVSLP